MSVEASCPARAGLLGNPSDGYGGRVIAITVPELTARVRLEPATGWRFEGGSGATSDLGAGAAELPIGQPGDGIELLVAAVRSCAGRMPALVERPARLAFATEIPRQVGLAGSSAIIIAALRALAARAEYEWDPVDLARTALEAETDILGWAAGPQDRVVQAIGGLVDMDFAESWRSAGYERVADDLLPALFVAWNLASGDRSDIVHTDVRRRFEAGDAEVVTAMRQFAQLAARGRDALDAGRAPATWPALFDEAFELRRSIWHLGARDLQLVDTGAAEGAGVTLAGSGGAVVGALPDGGRIDSTRLAYERIGAGFLVLSTGGA